MAAPKRAATAPAPVGVNFLDLGMYVAGGGLPEGDYCLFFTVQMYQAVNAQNVNQGPPRLGVMVDAYPLSEPTEEAKKHQFYSMGSNADKSFAPNPETGKGLVAVPGAQGGTLNNSTNWSLFLKSLYDCGLPQGVVTDDIAGLDGVHVHMTQVPEPEERKGFQSAQTGEAAPPQRQNKTIAIVTEIKDDGKPWENTGGIPETPAAKPNGKPAPAARPAAAPAKPTPISRPAAAAPVAAAIDGEELQIAAQNGASAVLEQKQNANGTTRLILKTGTFSHVKTNVGEDVASAVINTFFTNDDALNGLINPMGYNVVGGAVKPMA